MDWSFVGRTTELGSLVDKVSAGRSVLLTGPAGVGKSRLVEEAQEVLGRRHHVERLVGSPSFRHVPFGAVAHLGGDAPLPEPALLIGFITRAIRARAGHSPALVVIDDIDQLDDGSMAFAQHLLAHESIPLLATARTDGAAEPRVVALWKDGLIDRFDLRPLNRDETDELASSILGSAASTELSNEIWRLSEGHPLFVREILLDGIEQRTITERDGLWGLAGSLGRSQRVADIIEVRMASLTGDELDALRVLTLCEPVPLGVAKRLAPDHVLESLESKRMLRLETTTAGPVLRSSHPLIAEVTTARMPALTMATTTARLARVLLDSPPVSSTDIMRAALWLLDAGEVPPQDVAIQGARAALQAFDPVLARRLAESALSQGAHHEGLVVLGRAHAAAGEAANALSLLQNARQQARTESELAAATVALAEVHMFNLGDAPRAVRELETALESMDEVGPRAEVSGRLMLAVGITGDFDLGLRIGPEVVDRLDLPEPAQLTSVMAMTLTQTMTGKLDRVMERIERGEALALHFSDLQPLAPDQVGMNRLLAHQARAEFAEAESHAQDSLRAGVGLPGPWLFVRAIDRQFTGAIEEGISLAAEAETYFDDLDPLGIEPMAHGIRGLLEAMGANPETAVSLVSMVRNDPRGMTPRVAVWADRAEAWIAAVSGDTTLAAERAVRAGEAAVIGTHYVWGSFAFHDAVRFGHPDSVEASLRTLAGDERGPLVQLLADHARAAANHDVDAFHDVIQRSMRCGARALVAEGHAAAATMTDGPTARRHAHLAILHHRRCPGFRSPLVRDIRPPLSDRQFEIASLAAAGHRSKDIAARLHLSARTVDNHLRTVYRTFEVDGRTALASLFPA